jgi:hypothetical protein
MSNDATTAAASSSGLFGDGGAFDYQNLLPVRSSSSGGGGGDENDTSGQQGCFPALSYRERLLGCATCMVAGYLLSLGSFWRLKDLLVHHDPLPFVMNATIGNIIALGGSFFMSGPKYQAQRMFHKKRKTATIVYLSSLAAVLVVAVLPVPAKGLLLLILMGLQYVAILWYCLSYIPFAHDAIRSFVQNRLVGGDNVEY